MNQEILNTGWEVQDVYATDIHKLQSFYDQLETRKESFGLPFLIALFKGEVAGFASLIIGADGSIIYKCYNDHLIPYFSEIEWQEKLSVAFAQQQLLFPDVNQLNAGISTLMKWINQS